MTCKNDICCKMMKDNLGHVCSKHTVKNSCPDKIIDKHKNGNIGIIIHDGGSSMIKINYCPWCGTNLTTKKKIKLSIPEMQKIAKLVKPF